MVELFLQAIPALIAGRILHGEAAVELAPPCSIASIAFYGDDLKPLLDILGDGDSGGTLPLPGRYLTADNVVYLWSGPASWLALAAGDDPDFCARLAQRLVGHAAVTDQSDGRTILQVHGPAARHALAKLLPIDLHPNSFPPNATALTLAGHINVQIWRNGENSFALACLRSLAAALFETLQEACMEFQTAAQDRS